MEVDLTYHFKRMAIALFIAYKSMLNNETPVACIFVNGSTGEVEALGCNDTNNSLNGTRHAEFLAIDRILEKMTAEQRSDHGFVRQMFANMLLFVTVEPCVMCASALKQLGIQKVVFGCINDRFGGNGTVLGIHNDGIGGSYDSYGGILRTEAIQLLRNFYIQENESAPIPKIKKNKELQHKEYPVSIPFKKYLDESLFLAFYGSSRLAESYHRNEYEITPIWHRGYSIRDLVELDDLLKVPFLEDMYQTDFKKTLKEDLSVFYSFFYDIGDDGKPQFTREIITIDKLIPHKKSDHKKRKVDNASLQKPNDLILR